MLEETQKRNYETLSTLLKDEWPEQTFKTTKTERGSALYAPLEYDLVLPMAQDADFERRFFFKKNSLEKM